MNKDKEPLLSAEQFYKGVLINLSTAELMKAYAKYHTEWHLNNLKEIVCEEANIKQESEYIDCSIGYAIVSSVDKQSITNAIENYIKEKL